MITAQIERKERSKLRSKQSAIEGVEMTVDLFTRLTYIPLPRPKPDRATYRLAQRT